MENYFENAKTIQEKRSILKQLSEPIKVLVKMGQIECINEGLKTVYAQSGHCELKTLKQWNSEGKKIRKGEHALCLWGQPKQRTPKVDEADTEENDPLNFFPICFVFSNLQVYEKQ